VALGAGGCESGDKLFSNFTYTGGGALAPASLVSFNVTESVLSGYDIHGFTFKPGVTVSTGGTITGDGIWSTSFSLGYTIAVLPSSPQYLFGALSQFTLGPVPGNTSVATTTLSNGVVFNLSQGTASLPLNTKTALFESVKSLNVNTVVTIIPEQSGNFVTGMAQNYTQQVIPEPMTFVLIGTGLVGLGLLRRRARKS
jgi:hypothetical protein